MKYNIDYFLANNKKVMITKGGAYSNHIAAVAAAGRFYGFQTIGFIRGEKPEKPGVTLRFAESSGMQLHYISRSEFKDNDFINDWVGTEAAYFIPEGGTNQLALKGCEELITELLLQTDISSAYICLAGGTGGTTAGIVKALSDKEQVITFSALKGTWLRQDIETLLNVHASNLTVTDEYCFGGYAKIDAKLFDFINDFYDLYGIPLDPVYTAKMMYGLKEMLNQERIPDGSKIIAIHTGGLQGAFGFQDKAYKINWLASNDCKEVLELKSMMDSI